MSKKAKLSLIIFSAVLLSACTTTTPTGTQTQTGENQPTTTPTEQSSSTSMRELLAMGKNQKCLITFSDTDSDGVKFDVKGTLYVSGKNMAEEVQTTSGDKENQTQEMNMISDGTYFYTWDATKKTPGVKMTIPTPTGDTQGTAKGGVDLDKKVDMQCSPWVVDNSKFTIPTDVKFTDVSEMLKNIPKVPAVPTGK